MAKDVKLVDDARAIQSERASDFDASSAYGEVIDNSLQANCNWVKIHFSTSLDLKRGKKFEKIDYVAFGDNGDGMSQDILHRCLQLGYSSRYNDRTGVGRFGVGMIKGAIHECTQISIYSKEKNSDWHNTHIDIEKISNT